MKNMFFKNKSCEDIAVFEKVSFDQYLKDWRNIYGDDIDETTIFDIYNGIKLPERSTEGSAGYDFFAPFGFSLAVGENIVILTGIRANIEPGWFLMGAPRSGHGFKHKLVLANTVAIIDSDYYLADNEGHIMIKLVYDGLYHNVTPASIEMGRDSNGICEYNINVHNTMIGQTLLPPLNIAAHKGFCQGILMQYGTIKNEDEEKEKRTGGFGSTDKE